ncbi:hypothetical protein GCM10023319_35060 [Nocardia iowensis]
MLRRRARLPTPPAATFATGANFADPSFAYTYAPQTAAAAAYGGLGGAEARFADASRAVRATPAGLRPVSSGLVTGTAP